MLSVSEMIQKVLDHEGRVVHYDPDDPGGRTAFGISHRFNPQWEGWELLQDNDYDERAVGDAAILFYEKLYERCGAKLLPSHARYPFFDAVVNLGQVRAVEVLQMALNSYAQVDGWVETDGILGPQTINAIRTVDNLGFCHVFSLARIRYYRQKVHENHSKKKFFLGWVVRTLEVDEENCR